MKVVLFDGSEYTISKEKADKLEKLLATVKYVKINGDTIATSAISKITKGGFVQSNNLLKEPGQNPASQETRDRIRNELTARGIL